MGLSYDTYILIEGIDVRAITQNCPVGLQGPLAPERFA